MRQTNLLCSKILKTKKNSKDKNCHVVDKFMSNEDTEQYWVMANSFKLLRLLQTCTIRHCAALQLLAVGG